VLLIPLEELIPQGHKCETKACSPESEEIPSPDAVGAFSGPIEPRPYSGVQLSVEDGPGVNEARFEYEP